MKIRIFLSTFSLFLITICLAQPERIHLSWNKSKKNSTSSSIAVTWTSTEPNAKFLKIGMDSNRFRTRVASVSYSNSTSLYIYKATVSRLKAETNYYYICGSDEKGWSKVLGFHTGPKRGAAEKFVVGVWGDTQDNEFNTQFEKTAVIVDQLKKHPLDFTIHMGDIVENGSEPQRWRGLFSVTETINRTAPFMPVTGNHDVNNDTASNEFQKPFPVFYELFNLPASQVDYSFDYGNTHFIAVSSGHAKGAENSRSWRYAPGSAEYKWLEKDLRKARKDKKIKWVIMYMHHPLYSYGWSHVAGWQERLTGLVDKYKVDLCLSGHRHVYERHTAIRNNNPQPQLSKHEYVKPTGTVYVTNGTSGGSPQGTGGANMPSMVFTPAERMYNYAVMTIDGQVISYDVFNQKGERIDYFTLTK